MQCMSEGSPGSSFHLFLSYARKDNEKPVNQAGEGWVTAFERDLTARHQQYSGRRLEIFFDREAIVEGQDWRRRLGEGLRQSRLFLAFLTPNYITSANCLWEWEEYLRREHSAARGDDGVTPIFFVAPADLRIAEDQELAAWLAAMERKYPWFHARPEQFTPATEQRVRPFVADLHRRNKTANCELQSWFADGPEILKRLDAAERSAVLKAEPRDPAQDARTLADRLGALDRHIARRLDRIALADLAPGNVPRSHEHFVGRHRELSQLHTLMTQGGPQSGGRGMGGRGMIAATFAPGGLGKTALARQYAHAYAEFYAAGGTWEVSCEGASELGAVLLRLADSATFQRIGREVGKPLQISEQQRNHFAEAAAAVLDYLRTLTTARLEVVRLELQRQELHSHAAELPQIDRARALLILDNVDRPELLSAVQVALLPAEEWLEVIVTTRLDPDKFGGGDRTFERVEVGVLPEADAVRLLAEFQPGRRFASPSEEAAARRVAQALGGYTLAVEIVAAYIGDLAKRNRPEPAREFLTALEQNGLAWVDTLADKPAFDAEQRHSDLLDEQERKRQNRVATLIQWSLERLRGPARTALEFASLMMPDEIPTEWLRTLTTERHPEVANPGIENEHAWPDLWRELRGFRLLHPVGEIEVDDRGVERLPEVVRLHRLIAQHVSAADAKGTETFAALDRFFDRMTTQFEEQVGQAEDKALRAQHPWLRNQLEFLVRPVSGKPAIHALTSSLLSSAGVVASFEGEHGSLARALGFTEHILAAQEKLLRDNPGSAQAARDVSVSLNKLADFLASRGQAGDAEQALRHYERSLEVREQLLRDNPGSAQAARDVLVSLERMAESVGGRAGGEAKALELQTRSLQTALQLRDANRSNFFYQRTAAVSYFLTYQRAQAAGDQDLASRCLFGCFSTLDPLVQAGVELDPAMRKLYSQLKPLFST